VVEKTKAKPIETGVVGKSLFNCGIISDLTIGLVVALAAQAALRQMGVEAAPTGYSGTDVSNNRVFKPHDLSTLVSTPTWQDTSPTSVVPDQYSTATAITKRNDANAFHTDSQLKHSDNKRIEAPKWDTKDIQSLEIAVKLLDWVESKQELSKGDMQSLQGWINLAIEKNQAELGKEDIQFLKDIAHLLAQESKKMGDSAVIPLSIADIVPGHLAGQDNSKRMPELSTATRELSSTLSAWEEAESEVLTFA
jgi:hypothetical protein